MHRLFSTLLLALLACTTVACDDGGPDKGDAESETTATDTDADTEADTDPTGEPGTAGAATVGNLGQPPGGGDTTGDTTGDDGDTGHATHGPTTLSPPKLDQPDGE